MTSLFYFFTMAKAQDYFRPKDAVRCSLEYLSVVHHTSRQHNVGVGEGEIIK